MKRCFKCEENKNTEEFSKDKTTSDGFNAKCKFCVKAYRIQYEKACNYKNLQPLWSKDNISKGSKI